MSNRKPAGPATKSKNRQVLRVVVGAALCIAVLIGSATAQIVVNPHNGHRYEYVRIRGFINWEQARDEAVSRGGYLATVTDTLETRIVASLLAHPGERAFLGAVDFGVNCKWRWVTGEPWIYQNWAPGEPGGEEPCINSLRTSFELGGKWDADVGPLDGFIVEWNEPVSDTLLNLQQWPLSEGGNGHWYAVIPQWASWYKADSLAKGIEIRGATGHLATVTSPGENEFILNNILANAWPDTIFSMRTQYWLGGERSYGGGWEWVTGEPFRYTNWADSVPFGTDAGLVIAMVGYGFDINPPLPGKWIRRDPNCDPGILGCRWAVVEFDIPGDTNLVNLVQWPVSQGGNGHLYAYLPRTLSWDQARHAAGLFQMDGVTGHLATVTSQQENDFIFSNLIQHNGDTLVRFGPTWLGGYDDSLWMWVTGEPFVYTNWGYGEPQSRWVAMVGTPAMGCPMCPQPGEWLGLPNEIPLGSIVEFDTLADTTGLVSLMQWPVSEGGNGHWYAYLPAKLPWDQARLAAAQFIIDGVPGHLAAITSSQENDFAFRTVSFDSANPMGRIGHHWLGGYDDTIWTWVTGEPMVYTNWAFGQPTYPTAFPVVAIVGPPWLDCAVCPQPGEWVDHSREMLLGSIVEFDTQSTEPRVLHVPGEYPTIQLAIDTARHGDVVLVSPGTYYEAINFHGKNITVRGADGPLHTAITNERMVNLVTFDQGETHEAVLEGFTLSGGWIAVLCVNSGPTIRHNICVGQQVTNWAAICLSGPIDTAIDQNGNPRYGPHYGDAPAVIVNNTIVNSTNGGISSFSIASPTIWNNIVAFNAHYGIHHQGGFQQQMPLLGYNDVYNNGAANYYNIPDPGPGSISVDPLFDNRPFVPNYTLLPESPCIDAGDPNPRFNDPDGSRNDMGAVPFMGGPGEVVVPTNEWIVVYCSQDFPEMPGPLMYIQAYDPDGVLCGQSEYRVGNGNYGLMPIYRDDPYTIRDEGCQPGDLIQFKIDGIPTQPATPVYWTTNGDIFEICDFGYDQCVNIPLHTGWNLVSWNVAFEAPIRLALDEIIGCVDVVQSFEQGGLVFDPNLDGFNTLTHVDYHHGYWIRMNCDAMLQVCGNRIPFEEWIVLEPGWNLVSYWPPQPLPIEQGFNSILDSLQQAMGFDNGAQVWLPNMPNLNTLVELRPTFGYWTKVPNFMPLYYPAFVPYPDTLPWPWPPDSGIVEVPPVSETSRNWMSVYGDNITVDGQPLSEGAAISFCANETVTCGRGVYQGGALRLTPVYGHDGSGEVSKLYPDEGDLLAVLVNGQRVYPDLAWSSNGARVRLSRLTTDSRGLPQEYALAQNYPNPFNPGTMLAFDVPVDVHVNLSIFNVLGQQVRILTDRDYVVGRYELEWNGRDDNGDPVSTGVYFYRLTAGELVFTKKMMLLK